MLTTADPATYQLAVMIGATALCLGIGAWWRPESWAAMLAEIQHSPTLVILTGIVAQIYGSLILLMPGGWSDPLAIAVSTMGVASILKGLLLLLAPDLFLGMSRAWIRHARLWALVVMALGLAFIAAGLPGALA